MQIHALSTIDSSDLELISNEIFLREDLVLSWAGKACLEQDKPERVKIKKLVIKFKGETRFKYIYYPPPPTPLEALYLASW